MVFLRGLPYLQWHTSRGVLLSRSCADCYKHMCSELRDEGERKGFEAAQKEFTHVESLHQASRQSPSEKKNMLPTPLIDYLIHLSMTASVMQCFIQSLLNKSIRCLMSFWSHSSLQTFIYSFIDSTLPSFIPVFWGILLPAKVTVPSSSVAWTSAGCSCQPDYATMWRLLRYL